MLATMISNVRIPHKTIHPVLIVPIVIIYNNVWSLHNHPLIKFSSAMSTATVTIITIMTITTNPTCMDQKTMDPIINQIPGNWKHLTLVFCCHQVCGYNTIHLPTMIATRTCPNQNPALCHHQVVQCNILTMVVMMSNHHNMQSPQHGIVQMVIQNFIECIILLSMVCNNSTHSITTTYITCHRPDL